MRSRSEAGTGASTGVRSSFGTSSSSGAGFTVRASLGAARSVPGAAGFRPSVVVGGPDDGGVGEGSAPCRSPEPEADPFPVSRLPLAGPPSASAGLVLPVGGAETTPVAPVDAPAGVAPPASTAGCVPARASRTAPPVVGLDCPPPDFPLLLAEVVPLAAAPGVVFDPEPTGLPGGPPVGLDCAPLAPCLDPAGWPGITASWSGVDDPAEAPLRPPPVLPAPLLVPPPDFPPPD